MTNKTLTLYIFKGKRSIIQQTVLFFKRLDKNALDINVQDIFDRTPLFVAAKFGHIECVKELLKAGADKTIKAKPKKLRVIAIGSDHRIESRAVESNHELKEKGLQPTAAIAFSRDCTSFSAASAVEAFSSAT